MPVIANPLNREWRKCLAPILAEAGVRHRPESRPPSARMSMAWRDPRRCQTPRTVQSPDFRAYAASLAGVAYQSAAKKWHVVPASTSRCQTKCMYLARESKMKTTAPSV
jgi:hypothetical protein